MPDDRELLGHVDADFAQPREQAERDEVVEGDRRGRAGLEHGVGGVVAVLHAASRPATVEDLEVGVIARRARRVPAPRSSFGVGLSGGPAT